MPAKSKAKTTTKAKAKPKVKAAKTSVRVSLHTETLPSGGSSALPRGTVSLNKSSGALKINVERLSRSLMRDQRARMVSSMGCISNPGGPGC